MNPHNHIIALDPPGRSNRRWRCRYCGEIGLCDDLIGPKQKKDCSYVYPPCEYCNCTPTCAADCPLIAALLDQPNVRTVPAPKKRILN